MKQYKVRKGSWPKGPWKHEPDFAMWWDDETQYPCLIIRMRETGQLNGYVGVNWKHPLYRKHGGDELDAKGKEIPFDRNAIFKKLKENFYKLEAGEEVDFTQPTPEANLINNLEVHGGVTYSAMMCRKHGLPYRWWIGFDCAHFMDYSPGLDAKLNRLIPGRHYVDNGEVYRAFAYVQFNCRLLAMQLKDIECR